MRAWLHDNGLAGVREAAAIFAGLPAECARATGRCLTRRLHLNR